MTVHVFAGPTASAEVIEEHCPGAQVHPPVAHGDLLRLGAGRGDVIVIVDGYYHQSAPVRHKEILHRIDAGVRVVGCASMGAMRAAELDRVGMVGHGVVYSMFRDGVIDADDEVAVAHVASGRYEAKNLPLVNIRHAVRCAADAGVLSQDEASAIVLTAHRLHYTDRSWRLVRLELAERGALVDAVLEHVAEHRTCADVKLSDTVDTLRRLDELVVAAADAVATPSWRNELIYGWEPEFAGRTVDGVWVSDAQVLRFRQIYDADFERVWREFVRGQLEDGLDEDAVREQVEAFVPLRGWHDLLAHEPELVADEEVHRAVAEAMQINDTTMWRGTTRLVERLAPARLEKHLRQLWSTSDGPAPLSSQARSRGFASTAEAVSALRPFFLRDEQRRTGRLPGGSR